MMKMSSLRGWVALPEVSLFRFLGIASSKDDHGCRVISLFQASLVIAPVLAVYARLIVLWFHTIANDESKPLERK